MARPAPKSRPGRGGSLFTGLLVGLVVGIALAAGVALWTTDLNPFRTPPTAAPAPAPRVESPAPAAPARPEPPPLDFYRTLPGDGAPPPTAPAPAAAGPRYYLQAGAFQDAAQADNLKATLAMLGVEAAIRSEAGNADTPALHRVRVGPFTAMDAVNHTRALLQQNQIPTVLVREAPEKEEIH